VNISLVEERQDSRAEQSDRGGRQGACDGTRAPVTSGGAGGTSGERPQIPGAAYAGSGLFILAVTTVNALSTQHDAGPRLAGWMPFVWEYSSALTMLIAMPAIAALGVHTRMGRGLWLRFGLTHLLGTIGYCLAHVGGFVVLRKLAYATAGQHYVFGGLGQLIYEYRKDVVAYCALAVVFLLSAKLGALAKSAPQPAAASAEPEPVFDIRDGARLIRTPVKQIVSVRSAGNYVEVHLADGRRPLMRATLSTVEQELAQHGFVRSHRSWLINSQRVRALTPEGSSGDWSVELEGGGPAPISRRFPQALEALRRSA
jgi:DNA-binding LytR/AlgR family response regulator